MVVLCCFHVFCASFMVLCCCLFLWIFCVFFGLSVRLCGDFVSLYHCFSFLWAFDAIKTCFLPFVYLLSFGLWVYNVGV